MGLVMRQSGAGSSDVRRLPSGSFTVDENGRIISSTVVSSVPASQVREIARQILAVLKGARSANLACSELVVYYAALKITAREMRGGAIVFLSPRTPSSAASS